MTVCDCTGKDSSQNPKRVRLTISLTKISGGFGVFTEIQIQFNTI